ncbi:hypothetical protein DFQ30_010645 [Apophysomyces sp. BC1015]|nr:hypothetical protein DFQ30_010645 [Apophysomyces sp. BC1015]
MSEHDNLDDLDDFLDNDFFTPGIVEALDQKESQYLSTQRFPQAIGAAPSASTSRDVPVQRSLAPPVVIRDREQDPQWNRLDWETPQLSVGTYNTEEQQITSLHHTIERFQMELSQEKTTKLVALREQERLRIEASLKDQEIESLQFQLKGALKAKQRSAHFSPRAQTPSTSDKAPPTISQTSHVAAKDTSIQTQPSSMQSARSKPNLVLAGFDTRKPTMPVRPREKRSREEGRTSRKPTSEDLPRPVQQKKRQTKLSKKDAEIAGLLRRLFGKMYSSVIDKDASLEQVNLKLLTRDVLGNLSRRFARQLMPPPQTADTREKIAILESDLVKCLEQSPTIDIKSTIQQILDTLGLSFAIYREQGMTFPLLDSINTIRMLAEFYGHGVVYLLQQFRRVEEMSVLWNLTDSLALFPVSNTDKDLDKLPLTEMDPSKLSYQELIRFMRMYNIDPDRLRAAIHRKIPYAEAVHAVNQILDVLIRALISASSDKGTLESCVTILNHKGFLDLFSIGIPPEILSKATMILSHLMDSVKINNRPSLLNDIQTLMMAKNETLATMGPEWYQSRIMLLTLYNEVITSMSSQVEVVQDVYIQVRFMPQYSYNVTKCAM